jgi:hypothetical protein
MANAVFARRASSRPMLPYPMMPSVAPRTSVGTKRGQRCSSGGQAPFACHSTMRGTRCASASTIVSAYSAMVAPCTPLEVTSGRALSV